MKNKFFSLENFIKFHRNILHSTDKVFSDYKEHQSYKQGWTDCMNELEKYMNDTSVIDEIKKFFEEFGL